LTVVDAKHVLLHLDEIKPDGVVNESIQQARKRDIERQGEAARRRKASPGSC
jgi:hypothetical protein